MPACLDGFHDGHPFVPVRRGDLLCDAKVWQCPSKFTRQEAKKKNPPNVAGRLHQRPKQPLPFPPLFFSPSRTPRPPGRPPCPRIVPLEVQGRSSHGMCQCGPHIPLGVGKKGFATQS